MNDKINSIIDEHGCFSIRMIKSKYDGVNYSLEFILVSDDANMLNQLKTTYGGSTTGTRYVLYGEKCKNLVDDIYDGLNIKKRQADLFLTFPLPKQGVKSLQEDTDKKHQLYLEMRRLNSK